MHVSIFESPYCGRHKKSKKILFMEITDEHGHDNKMLPTLVDDLVKSKDGFATIDNPFV
ncbi:MAG: hypothetical protein L0H53_02535 [Candidatus Nitrosocosmicus sp.]|nr:hypothetical protein [Candidatus Nitrosocosmicus sp.]MDN5866567.1 hypothetical protein [Candidatus Nitrosocosmicus sp.]